MAIVNLVKTSIKKYIAIKPLIIQGIIAILRGILLNLIESFILNI